MNIFEPQWDKTLRDLLDFDGGETVDRFFEIVSGKITWLPLYLLMVLLLWRRYGWKFTLLAVVCVAVMVGLLDQTCNLLKEWIGKPRPSGSGLGAVSAHAATTFAIMTFTSSLVRARWFTILTIVWALLVAYSRLYLDKHYPLDLILGATLGIIGGVLMVRLYRWLTDRIRGRCPSEA